MAVAELPAWTFGERLAKARRSAGIKSQGEMARRLSDHLGRRIGEKAVATWEHDRSQPRQMVEVINAWSNVTGVPVEWLFGSSGNKPVLDVLFVDLPKPVRQMTFRLNAEPVDKDRRCDLASAA